MQKCGQTRHIPLFAVNAENRQKSVKGLSFSFHYPFRQITLLRDSCINTCQNTLFCNSSPDPSHYLHHCQQIVFYAFTALLTL
ncbi:hypothetical protein EAM_1611 [Erwinia amylovora ATCC 49946]|nr:hypothetical protein EAM_1611 [Erwinia amylovora ATCC 49946]